MKFSKIDLASASPSGLQSSYDDQMIVEQDFNIHIISNVIARKWRHAPFQMQVLCTLTQSGIGGNGDFTDAERNFRVGVRKLLNQVAQERGHRCCRTADPYLAHGRIGQKLDLFDALPQLIECGSRALEQRLSVQGGFDTAWAPVKEPHVQRVFKIGNHFRHVWLRYAKLQSGLSHAPVLNDRKKHVQIPQAETPTNLTV